jgi:hypothetical protein
MPMTKEWLKFLSNLKEEVKQDWSDSVYIGISSDETVQRNAFALGQVDIITRLLEADVKQIAEVAEDAK